MNSCGNTSELDCKIGEIRLTKHDFFFSEWIRLDKEKLFRIEVLPFWWSFWGWFIESLSKKENRKRWVSAVLRRQGSGYKLFRYEKKGEMKSMVEYLLVEEGWICVACMKENKAVAHRVLTRLPEKEGKQREYMSSGYCWASSKQPNRKKKKTKGEGQLVQPS